MKDRLIASHSEEWLEAIQNNERYSLFFSFKSSISLSSYLTTVKHIQARNFLIQVRLGVSQLNTHRFRFTSESTLCPLCKLDIESEKYFILTCPCHDSIRREFISKRYYQNPSLFKLTMLFATENKNIMLNLANYILHAFNLRNSLCPWYAILFFIFM